MAGIYIHIPFCKQACSYCDFYFVTRTSEREHFVQRLVSEIESYEASSFTSEAVQTIYFGGGTPSLLEPRQVERILEAVRRTFPMEVREITFEVNPDDVHAEFLEDLYSLGITRLSMGVQSFQPALLEFMHRAHSREEALDCLRLLDKSAFEAYTVDLIYGNPGQQLEELEKDLDLLLDFDPPHVSAYSLTVEDRTRLGKQVKLGRVIPPEEEMVAAHFDLVNARLIDQGIERYEVSNYSRPGYEAVHNSSYWNHHNYLGLGPGAHSFWWEGEAVRWEQKRSLREFLRGEDVSSDAERLTLEQLAEERLMMGLRTREGVSFDQLNKRYLYSFSGRQIAYLRERQEEGKLTLDSRLRLSDRGIKIADAIILDLITLH
ncbi:radical SAM family heme chaperone HemW [Fodinibius sediminis]|uniref:Heme chaperone HemW n=1 Tax=Fodinibius sediminis TaxID=1214077 RepID=A0A521AIG6_9BACT|nr:radical SAM family heme chaperone HemW [Fodinibius sediminis]SMO34573.1 oxygen-independent coproporphyrinogen-3 oxidase [Fodinibius sediminis]